MSAAERLDEYLDHVDAPTTYDEAYAIGDKGNELNEADWACRKLAKLEAQRLEIQQAGHMQIEAVRAWMAGEVTRLQPDIAYFTNLLVGWHQERMEQAFEEAGGNWTHVKGKTCRLPSGVATARMGREHVEIVDEGDFINWAMIHSPTLARVKYEPAKDEILKHVKETGELPPGVALVGADVKFTVVVGNDAKMEADDL